MKENEDPSLPGRLIRISQIGLNLVVATFTGLAIGYFLDSFLQTTPWLTLFFLIAGILSGFTGIIRTIKKEMN